VISLRSLALARDACGGFRRLLRFARNDETSQNYIKLDFSLNHKFFKYSLSVYIGLRYPPVLPPGILRVSLPELASAA